MRVECVNACAECGVAARVESELQLEVVQYKSRLSSNNEEMSTKRVEANQFLEIVLMQSLSLSCLGARVCPPLKTVGSQSNHIPSLGTLLLTAHCGCGATRH